MNLIYNFFGTHYMIFKQLTFVNLVNVYVMKPRK